VRRAKCFVAMVVSSLSVLTLQACSTKAPGSTKISVTPRPPGPNDLAPTDVFVGVEVVKRVPPKYTAKLKRSCGEGSAHVKGVVGRDGRLSGVTVLSATCEGLATEAVRVFKKWQFRPATVNGKPVSAYFDVQINFNLKP
jgi:TonB family protein